ncbi:Acid phosphatase, partial [Bertholletia excelsa]
IFCLNLVCSFGELQKFEHNPKANGSLSFLVIGDWGRRGFYNQSLVALQMGRIGEALDIDFVVSTGDNFYDNGLKGVNDPAFQESYLNIYTHQALQKPWYTVLGNHDYRGDAKAQLSPLLRKRDSRWICSRSFIVNTGIAEIFFVDTTPFVDDYFIDPEDRVYDWRGVNPRHTYLANLLQDLEWALKNSTAEWKIVVGHHAIRSIGYHGDTPELVLQLLPILEDNKVDVYMNGHDHCLQHLRCIDNGIQFLTSGGGSKAWRGGDVPVHTLCEQQLFYDGQGFMSVQLKESNANVVFYDIYGTPIHNADFTKQLRSQM